MKKPDVDLLLRSGNTYMSIVELDNYIADHCNYGQELDKLTMPQRNFFFNQELEHAINNGGFVRYFQDASGRYAHETLESLYVISAKLTAEILVFAIDYFPDDKVPKDDEERKRILEEMSKDDLAALKDIEQTFYETGEDLDSLNLEYVRKNRDFF